MKKEQKIFTIRRHLSKGKNFGFWQIRGYISDSKQGAEVEYVNPETHSLILENCLLYNKVNESLKIFNGGEKNPCAYIIFEKYSVIEKTDLQGNPINISFNPKKNPNWLIDNQNADFKVIETIITNGSKLFLK